MRRQLVPGPVVRLTVIKAKTRPGIEASLHASPATAVSSSAAYLCRDLTILPARKSLQPYNKT